MEESILDDEAPSGTHAEIASALSASGFEHTSAIRDEWSKALAGCREPEYAATWTFLAQATNGWSSVHPRLGYAYLDGDILISAGVFRRPADGELCVHAICPNAVRDRQGIRGHTEVLAAVSRRICVPLYVRKPSQLFRESVLSLGWRERMRSDRWHTEAWWEDDTFAERACCLHDLLPRLEAGKGDAGDKCKRFEARHAPTSLSWIDVRSEVRQEAKDVIVRFFQMREGRANDLSQAHDYWNMVHDPSPRSDEDVVNKVLLIDGIPVAYVVAERIGVTSTFGLYCNIAIYERIKYLSEAVIFHVAKMVHERGAEVLNLGGSETEGLDDFKSKFAPQSEPLRKWLLVVSQ